MTRDEINALATPMTDAISSDVRFPVNYKIMHLQQHARDLERKLAALKMAVERYMTPIPEGASWLDEIAVRDAELVETLAAMEDEK